MDTYSDLLFPTVMIALGFLFAVAFYESLSTRDVLLGRVNRMTRRLTRRTWAQALGYGATVAIGIPVLVVLWTIVLELALFLIGSVDLVDHVALIAVSVVGAARVLAYVREKTSHELAKAIPLSLAFLLLTGGALRLDEKAARLAERDGTTLADEMIVFLVVLELSLRIATDASHFVLSAMRRRRGIESDEGVWRTLWGAIRGRGAHAESGDAA